MARSEHGLLDPYVLRLLIRIINVGPFGREPWQHLAQLGLRWPVAHDDHALLVNVLLGEKGVEVHSASSGAN